MVRSEAAANKLFSSPSNTAMVPADGVGDSFAALSALWSELGTVQDPPFPCQPLHIVICCRYIPLHDGAQVVQCVLSSLHVVMRRRHIALQVRA